MGLFFFNLISQNGTFIVEYNKNIFIKIKLMVFPVAEALTPCLMGRCSTETRNRWKERYRYAKNTVYVQDLLE